ncbi:MAG: FAD-dependent oxidoreductase [Oscillospiraceae bacterium]|nr:FAD-dependent oxidoreductase [Oscillospiraceae bacterium]
MKRTRIVAILLVLTMVLGTVAMAAGSMISIGVFPGVKITMDGKDITPEGKEPFIYEDTTYVPLRFLSETLGLNVGWDAESETVLLGEKAPRYTPGTYTAEANGFAGKVTVWVTVSNDSIVEVVAQGLNETPGKGSVAIDELPGKIVAANGTNVDGVAGATVTSNAIKEAVKTALANKVAGTAPAQAAEITYTAGTYTGKGFGFHSYVTVETTFSTDAILSVKVVDNSGETPYLRDLCAETIPGEIVDNQSLNVDVVTGATWGSEAIINAVADCVAQAAGDDAVTALKSVKVAAPTAKDETYDDYDLCVVGGGGSGVIAAAVAAKAGLKVIVIEAADRFGGVSEIAGGGTLAIGTDIQKNGGVYETSGKTVEEVYDQFVQEYLDSTHYQASRLLIKNYLSATGKAADFLTEQGMTFTANGVSGIRYSTQGTRFGSLMERLEAQGVTALLATRGESLITNATGAVTGVVAKNATGGTTTIHAKAVILATGGMSNNTEMMKQYLDDYTDAYMNWGGSTANGDGVQMAWAIGAMEGRIGSQSHNEGLPLELHNLFDMDITTGNCLYANLAYEPMLRINPTTGRRISDEGVIYTPHYHGNVSMMSGGALVILDQAAMDDLMENGSKTRPWRSSLYKNPMKEADYTGLNLQEQVDEVIEAGYAYRADTLEELAAQLGIDSAVLNSEVAKYNTAVETGKDPEYDRDSASLVYPIGNGPFYALKTKIRNLGTYGGLVTDETLAVYHEDGTIIPGLYAAGFDALSWIGTSYFVDTTTLGWMTASGYMAGNSVVDYVTGK